MKTPIILKVFAIFNLLIALAGLFIGAAAVIDFIDNNVIWNRQVLLSTYIIICSGWLLFSSLSWFFGFRSAYSLLIISVISIFSFFIGVLNYAFEVGINRNDEKVALSVLIIGFTVYALFMLSSLLSKQVKDWKALNPEMKKSMLPMLLIFCVVTYGSHAGIAFGMPESIINGTEEAYYDADSSMVEEEIVYAEEEYGYDDSEYYEEEYGDYAYYSDPFESSNPINVGKVYPVANGGKTISNTEINGILQGFFNAFLSNDWIKKEAFHDEGTLTVNTGSTYQSVGNYYLGMASIYEYINPYFTGQLASEDPIDCYLYCYIEELSGISPLLVKSEDDRSFNKYDPELIKWMYTYLIPSPDASFLEDVMAKELYGKVFKRFFRLYTQSYFYIISSRNFEDEMIAYTSAALEYEEFYGPSYLYDRYSGAIAADNDGSLEPTSAIGFWLRRGIDKTDDECWLGIQKVMNQYDSKWFNEVKSVYNIETN